MLRNLRSRLTYANVMSTIAVFVAVGTGGAYAANTIFSTDIVDGEVKTADLADAGVTRNKIASGAVTLGKVGANAVDSTKVVDNSLRGDDLLESSLNKVFWSEMDIHLHETALRLLEGDADLDGGWMRGYQFALAGPIYAGTNEIQRNVIAERLLGLPR